jgi:hypothetical protein
MSALGLGKSRHPFRRRRAATLTLHFCDEDFAIGVRKNQPRRTREYPRTDVRTPHVMPAVRPAPSPTCLHRRLIRLAFPGVRRPALVWNDALPQRNCSRVSRLSPLPWMIFKRTRTSEISRSLILECVSAGKKKYLAGEKRPSPGKDRETMERSHQHMRNRRYVTCQAICVIYVSPTSRYETR